MLADTTEQPSPEEQDTDYMLNTHAFLKTGVGNKKVQIMYVVDVLKREIRRMHALRSFPVYLVALILCTCLGLLERLDIDTERSSYQIHLGVSELLQETTFSKIQSERDLWSYMEENTDHLFRTLADIRNASMNDRTPPIAPTKNVPIGYVVLRQFRRKPVNCSTGNVNTMSQFWKEFLDKIPCANDVYTRDNFGPNGLFRPVNETGLRGTIVGGALLEYNDVSKGYVFGLSLREGSQEEVRRQLKWRQEAGWIDERTAASIYEIVLYNPSMARFTISSLLTEISMTGGFSQNIDTFIFEILNFEDHRMRLILTFDALITLILVAGLLQFILSVYSEYTLAHKWMTAFGFWDLFLLGNLGFLIRAYVYKFELWSMTRQLEENSIDSFASEDYNGDADAAMWQYISEYGTIYFNYVNSYAFGLLGLWLYSFYYMRFTKRLGLVTQTITHAIPTLITLMFVFLTLMVGFSLACNYLYGHAIDDFQTVSNAFSYLARVVFSADIDMYRNMKRIHPTMTPFLVVIFLLLTWISLFNMVLAVIAGSFQSMQDTVQRHDELMKSIKQLDDDDDEIMYSVGKRLWNQAKNIFLRLGRAGYHYTSMRHKMNDKLLKESRSKEVTLEELVSLVGLSVPRQMVEVTFLRARVLSDTNHTAGVRIGQQFADQMLEKLNKLTGGEGGGDDNDDYRPPRPNFGLSRMLDEHETQSFRGLPPRGSQGIDLVLREIQKLQNQIQKLESRLPTTQAVALRPNTGSSSVKEDPFERSVKLGKGNASNTDSDDLGATLRGISSQSRPPFQRKKPSLFDTLPPTSSVSSTRDSFEMASKPTAPANKPFTKVTSPRSPKSPRQTSTQPPNLALL